VFENQAAILALAGQLCQVGGMDEHAIGEFVHDTPALSAFKPLYPRAGRPPSSSSMPEVATTRLQRRIRTVTTAGAIR
jgi:hypothetical protein